MISERQNRNDMARRALPIGVLCLGHLTGPRAGIGPVLLFQASRVKSESHRRFRPHPSNGGERIMPADLGMIDPLSVLPLAYDPAPARSQRLRDPLLGGLDFGRFGFRIHRADQPSL